MKLVEELKRRRVFKVAGIYVVAMFATLQGAQVLVESLTLPAWTMTMLTLIGLFAFPIVLALTWVFDVIKAVGTHPRFQSYLRKLKLPEVTP